MRAENHTPSAISYNAQLPRLTHALVSAFCAWTCTGSFIWCPAFLILGGLYVLIDREDRTSAFEVPLQIAFAVLVILLIVFYGTSASPMLVLSVPFLLDARSVRRSVQTVSLVCVLTPIIVTALPALFRNTPPEATPLPTATTWVIAIAAVSLLAFWHQFLASQALLTFDTELRGSLRRLNFISKNMQDTLLRIDNTGRIRESNGPLNAQIATLKKHTPLPFLSALIHEADHHNLQLAIESAIRDQQERTLNCRINDPSEDISPEAPYSITLKPIERSSKHTPFELVACLSHTATQGQSAPESHFTNIKEQFLANMSHELRTPLNAIIGFSELIHKETGHGGSTDSHEYASIIYESGQHLLELINGLLDFSGIEDSGSTHAPPLDLDTLCDDCIAEVSLRATRRGIELRRSGAAGEAGRSAVANPSLVKRVIQSLLATSIKFVEPGGHTYLSADVNRNENTFSITITDNGIGIDDGILSQIGVPLQESVSSAYVSRQSGTTLALSLIQDIIKQMNGRLEINHNRPGKPNTMRITLPHRDNQ